MADRDISAEFFNRGKQAAKSQYEKMITQLNEDKAALGKRVKELEEELKRANEAKKEAWDLLQQPCDDCGCG